MCHFGRTWRKKEEGRDFAILSRRGDEDSPTINDVKNSGWFICSRIKKKAKTEGKKCHAKTM